MGFLKQLGISLQFFGRQLSWVLQITHKRLLFRNNVCDVWFQGEVELAVKPFGGKVPDDLDGVD